MNTTTSMPVLALSAALALVAAACDGEPRTVDAAPGAASGAVAEAAPIQGHEAHAAAGPDVLEGSGPWSVTAGDGSRVTLAPGVAPLKPGRVVFTIQVAPAGEDVRPHSVDLVSPTMPMHGVVRTPVDGDSAVVEIPMEGTWTLYVNLDAVGANTAEFVFAVAPDEASGHTHSHGGMNR